MRTGHAFRATTNVVSLRSTPNSPYARGQFPSPVGSTPAPSVSTRLARGLERNTADALL
jgi:hypothetical protein